MRKLIVNHFNKFELTELKRIRENLALLEGKYIHGISRDSLLGTVDRMISNVHKIDHEWAYFMMVIPNAKDGFFAYPVSDQESIDYVYAVLCAIREKQSMNEADFECIQKDEDRISS